ncbi:MAG: hypothetical protein WC465_05135 [Patescibacteria group bacterium]
MTKKVANHNSFYIKLVSFFLLLTIAAIFLILHFALSRVTIKIYSQIETKSGKAVITMQPETKDSLAPNSVIGKIISTDLTLSATGPATATTTPAEKAGGYVTIYNNTTKDQSLVKTTRLQSTDKKIYRINQNINVPAHSQAQVWAEADKAGADYVIGASRLTIPGLWVGLQDKIYAENTAGFKLEAIPSYTVTEADIQSVKNKIIAQAEEQGLKNINDLLPDDLKIDTSRLNFTHEITKTSYIGENAPQVEIEDKVTVYGLIFSVADLEKVAQNKFIKDLDSNQSLIEFLPDQFSYQITEIDPEKNEAIMETNLTANINSTTHTWTIDKDKIAGQNETSIKKYLQDELGIEKVEIKFFPFWVKTAPKLKDHIIIE